MSENLYEKINQTAMELFREQGYANVTVQEICTACGITKPTFYKYVGSKENLLLQFYEKTVHKILIGAHKFLELDSHYAQLLLIFQTLIRRTKEYGRDFFGQMFAANLARDHGSLDLQDDLTKLGVLIIRNAQKAGEIANTSDPAILYRSIAYMYTGYECMWCIKGDQLDWETELLESIENLLQVRKDLRVTGSGEKSELL